MNMPADVAKWLLFYLHILKTDDLSPQFFLGGNLADYPPGTSLKQQLVVDMIYRCLKCNLIDIDPENWRQAYGLGNIEAFANELARVDPNSPSRPGDPEHEQHLDRMLIWLGPQFYGTNAGNVLVDRYFPGKLDLEDAPKVASFNKEICEIFEVYAVPWTGEVMNVPTKGWNKGDGGN